MEQIRLDTLSLRCLVAATLASGLSAHRPGVTAEEVIEMYFEVLTRLRDKPIYPKTDSELKAEVFNVG